MEQFPVIAPYAALLALFYVLLSVGTIRQRRRSRTALGLGQDEALIRMIRAHANFSEYVPLALLLLWLLEFTEFNGIAISLLASLLVIARASHAYGLLVAEPTRQRFIWRILGMAGTFTAISISAILMLISWLRLYFVHGSV